MRQNQAHTDMIDLERGRAIAAFAKLEGTLCWILSEVGGLEYKTASTIFYSNISLQPRVEIITALLNEMSGNTFEAFWNSVCKAINSLNKQRNKIVHWHSYPVYDGKKGFENTHCVLIHPVVDKDKSSQFSTTDIQNFTKNANYLTKVLSGFRLCFDSSLGEVVQQLDIDRFATKEFSFSEIDNDPFKTERFTNA
ncbi:TPA: hypothetical protein ACN32G_004497 [Vibrio parahaemolyticus]|nr:hypothetical protein [Vibrio parahaemolyticus]